MCSSSRGSSWRREGGPPAAKTTFRKKPCFGLVCACVVLAACTDGSDGDDGPTEASEGAAASRSQSAPDTAAPITTDEAYCRLFATRMSECMPSTRTRSIEAEAERCLGGRQTARAIGQWNDDERRELVRCLRLSDCDAVAACMRGDAPASGAGGERSSAETRELALAGATLVAPADWPPLEAATRARLEGASRRSDPGATSRTVGARRPDERAPLLSLMSIRHSAPVSAGATPAQVMEDARLAYETQAAARGATVRVEGDCPADYCEYTVRFRGTVEMRQRVRVWRADGVLQEVACGCLGDGCAYFASCSLPTPG